VTLVNILLFDLAVFWCLVLPGTAECRGMDGLYRAGLSMHFLHEKNGIWITLELVWEVHVPSKVQGFTSENYLGDNYKHPISLILLVCVQLHDFCGEGSSRIWLEFYGLCICVMLGVCMRSVLSISHIWQKPAVLFLLVLMPHTPHAPGLFSITLKRGPVLAHCSHVQS